MSGKSAKKKRLGSRRVAPNQNVSSEEINVTDGSSVAQHHVLEESSESLNAFSNPDDSKPETQQTPSPDITMSRRKLGSSRRNKGRQFAKDSETEPYLEHREEVEEKTRVNKTVEATQTSLAAQLDRQEESSQGSVLDISATPNSSLSSASTPDYYYSEVKSPSTLNSPEHVTEILTPKPGNLQADQTHENETKLEKTDKSDTPQSAEMEENVGILELPHLNALSSISADQQLINIQLSNSKEMPEEKFSHVYSVAEMGSSKDDDTDLFRQDESLQGNILGSESQVGSVALEFATDKNSPGENTAIEDNVEQAKFLLPKEELPTSGKLKELFNLPELKDGQQLEDIVNNVHEQDLEATQMQTVDQDDYSPESLILDATENVDICAGNLKDQADIRDVTQFELSGKVTDEFAPKQKVSNPDDKQDEDPIKVDNLEADFKVVLDTSVGATLEGVDKSDTGAGRSEDSVQKVQEEEGQTTEMLQIDNLSVSAVGDATDNSKIIEIITTLPSEVMVESIDDSVTKQEVSNPDDKQDEHPTKEDNLEALDQISEDNPSYDTKTPQTSDVERVDTALVQVSECDGRVEDDVKPNPEQTFHQVAAQLFSEMEDIKFPLQSFESETNVASDSQPHDSSASIDVETNTGFQHSDIRRKLGSSRRNKGRQPVKESKEEALENTTSDEDLKIIKMSLATSQEDLSQGTEHNAVPSLLHDSSMFSVSTLGYSSEVQKPAATNHPEADLGNSISKSENLQQDRETDFKVVSDKSVGATLEAGDKSDTGAHQSENNSKIFEIITPHSSEVMVKSTDDSATKQEVSTPTVKQDTQPTKEDNLEALDQISEDNPLYDTKTPQISDIERVDTALVQVSESEGGVEDDVKPNPEQMFHHGMEQLISQVEDSKSLQSFQSETNVFDSQPLDSSASIDEKTNTGFQQSDIRRKLGSRRRNKGKQQVKDNEPTEEADGNTKGHEPSETTEISLTSETADQEKSTETMLEGMNRFDTRPTEEENTQTDTHVCTSELTTTGKHSSPTVDKQVIDLSHCMQMPDEDLLGVRSVTDTESKERDEYTDLLRLNENLPEDPLVSKTQVSPFTVEISTEKISPGEYTELEFRAEKATGSSQKDELSTKQEQLSNVRGAQHSEDAVKKVDEQDIQPTQVQDEQQNYDSPESLILRHATEKVDTSFGNLKDQPEMRDTNQPELSVKITDDSAPKEEVSNPDDKQDQRPTQERRLEASDQRNEDSDVYDSKQPLIKNTEREDTALGQVNEGESQVDNDVKHKDEQAVHQDNEGVISEVEKSTFSPQTLLSDIDAPFDSNRQDISVSVDEQTNTGIDLRGNRRKLGSSRRKKERQQGKESKEEVLEITTSDEALEITKMPLAPETRIQEDLSQGAKHDVFPSVLHDSSMFLVSTPGYSEVQKPAATNHPEADLGSLIPQNENLQEDQEDRQTDFKGMPDKSVGDTLEEVDTSGTVVHQSEVNVKKMEEEEGKTTEMLQIDKLSAGATVDATDNSKIVEIITTLPSEVMVKSSDDSATKQEVLTPDDKQDEHPTKEDNLEASDQISENNPTYDTKTPQTSDIERVDTALVQVSESDGRVEDDVKPNPEQMFHQEAAQLFSEREDIKFPLQSFESETNVASDSQPHDSSVSIDVETNTGFQHSDIRRKLGSSRRNKGRQQLKDNKPTEETDENKIDHEPSETTETPLTTETADQEKSAETMLEGMNKFDTHQTKEENRQLPDENLLDFYSIPELEKGRYGAQHLEDAVKKVHDQEIKPIQIEETPQIDNTPVSVIDDETNITETFIDLIEIRDIDQSKLAVKSTDDDTKEINFESSDQEKEADHVFDAKKPQLSDIERADTALGDYVIESQVKDDTKSSAGKTGRQEAGLFSEMEDSESSLQSLQHELHAALDSKPQQNNTSFNSGGNTRKLGSSQEKSTETMLEGKGKSDIAQIKDTVHVKQNEHFGPLYGISEFNSSSLHSSPVVDRQQIESNSSEMPDKGLPITSSVIKNKEKDENTELLRQDGHSQGSDLFSESHVESENIESPTTMEITTEKSSSREHTKVESSVEQSSKSAPKKELALSGEQNECFNPFEVTGAEQSEDVVNKVHEELTEPIQVQELFQIDTGPRTCLQALPSELNTPLDSQQDEPQSIKDKSPTGPNPAGSRRKLGSSRRNKGRQHAKEEATENTRDDEASKTPNISLAIETARQEELTDIKSPEQIRKISSTVNEDENTEKLPDKDTFFTDSSTVVTADNDFLKSNKDVDDKDKKLVKEPENLSHLTGHDTDKMDLMQAPQASVWKDDLYMQNISHHDDSLNAESSTVDILAQEEASQLQNTEDLLRQDADVQQINDVIETVGHVMMESSVDKQGPGQSEVGQNFEDSTNKIDAVQEKNTSHMLVSTAQERVEDVESGISTAMDASNSQEENQSDYKKTLQVKSNQKRRKMGSTRRNQLNRKQEGETDNKGETTESEVNTEADVRNLDEMEDVKELVLSAKVSQNENATALLGAVYKEQQEGNEISSAHDEGHQLESSTSNLQSSEGNVIPGLHDLMALLPEPSASHTEEAVDPDRKDGERSVDVGVEPSQLEEFTSSKTQITPVIPERNRRSLDQLLPLNTETTTNTGIAGGSPVLSETTETTQNDDERAESATETQDQDSTEQKPNIVIEEAQVKIPEMKNASPNLTPTNRRRKMGSTRRNLGSRNKGEDLDNEATETEIIVGDVKAESVPGIKEKELQLHTEYNEGDPEQERLLETVEYSQAGESHSTPPTQQTVEKKPVSQGELLDTEQRTPNYLPSTSTKNDTMSMSAPGGRRRKMGSHRKSRGHQGYGDQTEEQEGILDEQNGTNVRSIPEEGAIKPYEEHKEEPSGLQKISEGDDRDKKPSSNIIISKPGEHSRPVSEKTPFQPSRAENRLGQEQFSLAGDPRGGGLRSDSYHVVMIGDSSVGKTSFMKRAQTGKFSLDIPSSIGLDSCMWTVVVDGKPVVLELWDTAGQERFRSITRHIFHKAQAFLLMYDITCTESFSAVSYWANCIQESATEDVTVLLLGNKSDCAKRQVKTEQGEILAKEYNFEFMECSAATGENVVQCLETVARMLNQKIGTREEATVVQQEAGQKKRSTCC